MYMASVITNGHDVILQ